MSETKTSTTACPDCGWREGDGVRACTYSSDLGQRTHGNKHPTGLSPEQASLYDAYSQPSCVAWISEADRERVIASTIAWRAESWQEKRALAAKYGWKLEGDDASEAAWRATWEAEARAIPLQVAFSVADWTHEAFLDGRVYMYRRHVCGGHAHNFGYGYRLGCTGCGVTIQLGEHGVDEDYG